MHPQGSSPTLGFSVVQGEPDLLLLELGLVVLLHHLRLALYSLTGNSVQFRVTDHVVSDPEWMPA